MDLERADTGREINDPAHVLRLQPLHERVHAKAKREIEHQWPILHQ